MSNWFYEMMADFGLELQPEETEKPIKFNVHGNSRDGLKYINVYFSSSDRAKYCEGSVQFHNLTDSEEFTVKWNLHNWLAENEFLLRKSYSDDNKANRKLVARKLIEWIGDRGVRDNEAPGFFVKAQDSDDDLIADWVLMQKLKKSDCVGKTLSELISLCWFGDFYFDRVQLIDVPWYKIIQEEESDEDSEHNSMDEEDDSKDDDEQPGFFAKLFNRQH